MVSFCRFSNASCSQPCPIWLLQGDLALLSENGNRSLPIGHIVAHNADHALHVKFAKALKEACSADDMVDVQPPPEEEEPST